MPTEDHERWMRCALALAREAEDAGEVPVGCVVVAEGEIVGQARNSPIDLLDPTAHAEMLAIRQAALAVGNYRLNGATLYCTLEPCAMCAGALVAARIETLVFGARDLRFGGVRSKFQIADSPLLNHRLEIIEGVLGAESTEMLQRFFNARR
jgi:tRNA(adenine34) deaminase